MLVEGAGEMRVEQVLVTDGLAKDAADEAEVGQVVGVDTRHGVGLVGGAVRSSSEESVVLEWRRKEGRKGGRGKLLFVTSSCLSLPPSLPPSLPLTILNISRAIIENHSRVNPPASMPREGGWEGEREGGRVGERQ
jgi:hypothetical protein